MREIKFKAWDKAGKTMSDPFTLRRGNLIWRSKNETAVTFKALLEEDVVMQYTGLKDKHGKEIFEGDLLKAYPKESNGDHRIYLVSYEAPHFWVENVDKNYPLDVHHLDEITDIEVIGNSYENTEYVTTEPNRTIQMISKANRNP